MMESIQFVSRADRPASPALTAITAPLAHQIVLLPLDSYAPAMLGLSNLTVLHAFLLV